MRVRSGANSGRAQWRQKWTDPAGRCGPKWVQSRGVSEFQRCTARSLILRPVRPATVSKSTAQAARCARHAGRSDECRVRMVHRLAKGAAESRGGHQFHGTSSLALLWSVSVPIRWWVRAACRTACVTLPRGCRRCVAGNQGADPKRGFTSEEQRNTGGGLRDRGTAPGHPSRCFAAAVARVETETGPDPSRRGLCRGLGTDHGMAWGQLSGQCNGSRAWSTSRRRLCAPHTGESKLISGGFLGPFVIARSGGSSGRPSLHRGTAEKSPKRPGQSPGTTHTGSGGCPREVG